LRLTKVPEVSFKQSPCNKRCDARRNSPFEPARMQLRETTGTSAAMRKFQRYVRLFARRSSRLTSPRLAGEERQRACIRENSNSRPAFHAACILRLVPALKFHPCPSASLAQPFLTLSYPFQSPTFSFSLSLSLSLFFSFYS